VVVRELTGGLYFDESVIITIILLLGMADIVCQKILNSY